MGQRISVTLLTIGAAYAALIALSVQAETLVYKAENKWVAQEDNAPLQKLMQQARDGKSVFKVKLPNENRELAIVRLDVVMRILEREAKKAILFEETGTSRAGTLIIE